jgi:hypothetical protein
MQAYNIKIAMLRQGKLLRFSNHMKFYKIVRKLLSY